MLFSELGLCQEVLDGIRDMGFETATEIQQEAIPLILKGSDILATSATGSGKTAAFALPMLHTLMNSDKNGIQALILAPTRELAQQIDEQLWVLGYHTGLSSVTVYGGSDWAAQERALKNGVNIIVATPGRLLDQIKLTDYDFSKLKMLVLDEADRMLDMGFIPDVQSIINRLPQERQSILFSATMTPKIEALAKQFTRGKYDRIKIGTPAPAKGINQVCYRVTDDQKTALLLHLYETQKWHSAIVFASTKRGVEQLARALNKKGAQVEAMHGDKEQKDREITLERFKSGKVKVIIATDVMARGIDVDNISHIVNYDVPNDADDYIHRIGRTARAESTGDAITFMSPQDTRKMKDIFRVVDSYIPVLEVPEELYGRRPQSPAPTPSLVAQNPATQSAVPTQENMSEPRPANKRRPPRRKKRTTDDRQDAEQTQRQGSTDRKGQPPVQGVKNDPRDDRRQPNPNRPKQGSATDSEKPNRGPNTRRNTRKKDDTKNMSPREKYEHKQSRLIEQVQQSSLPSSKNEVKKEEKKGLWGKIKSLFS